MNNIQELVNGWSWHGSWFPIEQCFKELKSHVPAHHHDELRRLIEVRATEHDNSLE